ncbi:hypothetical protein ACUUL3_02760 [Thiovibrio sp. JS02]
MVRAVPLVLLKTVTYLAAAGLLFGLAGCGFSLDRAREGLRDFVTPTDASIIRHHVRQYHDSLYDFTSRLYAKNPRYEKDPLQRSRKLAAIFNGGPAVEYAYAARLSHEILAAAFSVDAEETDRVYLLALGLWKSIKEAYNVRDEEVLLSGLQVSLERLQRLHHNISQVNWRLKTCKDKKGELLFLTNAMGEDGYINMGYEVIMTRILTRIEDDIAMRGGLPQKYFFRMSTIFVSIAI